jgi:membrane protein implicated in regulation of membrane protease activity
MWFILGVILLVVEAMHTGVLAVFFALGAWVTATLMWLGVIESSWAQLAVFLIVSVVSLLLLRSELRKWLTGLRHPAGEDAALDDFAGNLATVTEAIGISDYRWATIQLAQTTMRSMIGKIDLDRTFEERDAINAGVVAAVDKASEAWGIKITRYEIKTIELPASIKDAMEKQMRAEREKRAAIAQSDGERQAAIARSEGEMTRRINEANGEAQGIELRAKAQANAFREIAASLQSPGGADALNLRVAQEYIAQFGNLAKAGNTVILPSNLADIAGIVASLTQVFGKAAPK